VGSEKLTVPLRYCGTGVEQLLALAAAILTATPGQVFLIDEPQAYLHPHAERALLQLLESHPEHQYVIATHSPTLLSSRLISQARLFTLSNGATTVTDLVDEVDLLDALGVTAADLWLADRLLWVEGPSDIPVLEAVASAMLTPTARAGLQVRAMPGGASRFSSDNEKRARALFDFCAEIVAALNPLHIDMIFLFDRDEKSERHRTDICRASQQRARFLPVREIENLFLWSEIIQPVLAERCDAYDRGAPTQQEVENALEDLLSPEQHGELFPSSLAPEDDPRAVIKGSAALDSLWWDFVGSEFRKTEDGPRLAREALAAAPDRLQALREILDELAESPRSSGAADTS
jgi:hypothetical protein